MQLRPYNPYDFESLYAVEERCFQPPLRFDRDYMLKLLTQKKSISFVVEEQKNIIAFAIASIYSRNKQHIAYIETIEVLSEFRTRGLARKLLTQLELEAQAHSASLLWLHVDSANQTAIQLYESSGYQKIKEQPNFYPDGNSAFIYKKSLTTE